MDETITITTDNWSHGDNDTEFGENCKIVGRIIEGEPLEIFKDYKASDLTSSEYKTAGIFATIASICETYNPPDYLEDLNKTQDILKEPSIDQLKRQIKHCKNPLELKELNKQLNYAYKARRKKK